MIRQVIFKVLFAQCSVLTIYHTISVNRMMMAKHFIKQRQLVHDDGAVAVAVADIGLWSSRRCAVCAS